MSTAYRQCLMLRMIPRLPRKIATSHIKEKLHEYGINVDLRTIQRDLNTFSDLFPLTCDSQNPKGWSWAKDGVVFDIPQMDTMTAMSFRMVEEFLSPLMPPATLRGLEAHFKQAENVLDALRKAWPDKIRILNRSQPLAAPNIDNRVLETVYECLLEGKRFSAVYKRRGETSPVEYTVNPLGIVMVDTIIYLVCTMRSYNLLKDVKQISLHRILSAEKTNEDGIVPEGFNLQGYINSGAFNYLQSDKTIKLKAVFNKKISLHLLETALSDDQTISDVDTEHVIVKATVLDTAQLRWWLLGFGENVEVLEPDSLRDEFIEKVKNMMSAYSIRQKLS